MICGTLYLSLRWSSWFGKDRSDQFWMVLTSLEHSNLTVERVGIGSGHLRPPNYVEEDAFSKFWKFLQRIRKCVQGRCKSRSWTFNICLLCVSLFSVYVSGNARPAPWIFSVASSFHIHWGKTSKLVPNIINVRTVTKLSIVLLKCKTCKKRRMKGIVDSGGLSSFLSPVRSKCASACISWQAVGVLGKE